MSRKTGYKADSRSYVRCGHSWCTDCRTKRGHKRGIRRARHAARALLRRLF